MKRRASRAAAASATSTDAQSVGDDMLLSSSVPEDQQSHFGALSQSWSSEASVLADMQSACEQFGTQLEQDYQYHNQPGHSGSLSTSATLPTTVTPDLDLSLWLGGSLPTLDNSAQPFEPRESSIALPKSPASSSHRAGGDQDGSNVVNINTQQSLPEGLSPRDLPYVREEWTPSPSQLSEGLDLFFTHVSHFLPFLHQPTFDATTADDHLLLAMLSLAYQHGEDPEAAHQPGSGDALSTHCFHRARVRIAACDTVDRDDDDDDDDDDDNSASTSKNILILVQTYLLLEIASIFYLCGKRDSASGLKMHSKMISLARFGGLTQPTHPLASTCATSKNLESLWHEFLRAEIQKRTMLAAHQIDALWYQFFSIPRSLSHLEIKHELPCPEPCWSAGSAAEWAHRQLILSSSSTPANVQYADAVRRFLSPDPDALDALPPFDPYGAINITQFLLSSAREVSGWSAMTGRLSLERLDPLRASLVALAPAVRPSPDSSSSSSCAAEATWEMAMIELQIWSASHTCGIVEGSVAAVLKHSTYLASSCEVLFGAETAAATQPHLDWFLRYLDQGSTVQDVVEPPWVGFYAYKAFLIAWQLVCKGVPGAMDVVGVHDGDAKGALAWAKGVFRRRGRRRMGRLMLGCLEQLEGQCPVAEFFSGN